MFRTVPLSIIRSFSLYTQQWYMSYRYADSLRAEWGRNWVPSSFCSQAVSIPVWHIPLLCVQWKTPDDGQRNCPKQVVLFQKYIWEIIASSWFYFNNVWWKSLRWSDHSSRGVIPNASVTECHQVQELPLHQQWIGRRGQTMKERKKERKEERKKEGRRKKEK